MTKASLPEIRRALQQLPEGILPELCLRMAKFRKENKELLAYLLFEADDEPAYIQSVKAELTAEFKALNRSTPYQLKKGIRKILALTNQRIRYSGQKRTEAELLLDFCKRFRREITSRSHPALKNLYLRLVIRLRKCVESLHEDLQFDFQEDLKGLEQ